MVPFQISISKEWLHNGGGFTFDRSYYFDPYRRRETDLAIDAWLENTFKDIEVHNFESNLVQEAYVKQNLLRVGALQPNLILGSILGAEFVFPDNADADIDRSPLKSITDEADLPPVDSLLNDPLIRLFDEQLIKAGTDISVTAVPPFFWDTSRRATIHGILTTAHKLVGEEFFIMP